MRSTVLPCGRGKINFQIETSTICCSRASQIALRVRHYIDLIVDVDFIMDSAVLRAAEKAP